MEIKINNLAMSSIAPLTNVFICTKTLERALNRGFHLPGLTCFYGPAGYGKTKAIAFTANKYNAYTIEAKSHWTRKGLLSKILLEMNVKEPAKTLESMVDLICNYLAKSGRALIIDEADHLANKGLSHIELIRDIYDASGVPIMLVGEENLPHKLKKWERFYSRILDWAPAMPPTLNDALMLRDMYCLKVTITNDLVEAIFTNCGSVRLIAVNLDLVQATALDLGVKSINLELWGQRKFYRGDAPLRRF